MVYKTTLIMEKKNEKILFEILFEIMFEILFEIMFEIMDVVEITI